MIIMLLIKAVDYRILELCKAYNLSINGLANKAGMPPSTVASLLSEKSRNPTEDTIFKRLCHNKWLILTRNSV